MPGTFNNLSESSEGNESLSECLTVAATYHAVHMVHDPGFSEPLQSPDRRDQSIRDTQNVGLLGCLYQKYCYETTRGFAIPEALLREVSATNSMWSDERKICLVYVLNCATRRTGDSI